MGLGRWVSGVGCGDYGATRRWERAGAPTQIQAEQGVFPSLAVELGGLGSNVT